MGFNIQNAQVRMVKLNWDEECRLDFLTKKGFEITETAFDKEKKLMNGIHSPRFATDWGDDSSFAERYSCSCKNLLGRVFEGETCNICGTMVKFVDVDLNVYGWIKLKRGCFIQPTMYNMIASAIGKTQLAEIVEIDKDYTRDGKALDKKSKNPFKSIGLIEFRDRFEEVMEYFHSKKKDKRELIEDILAEKDIVFATAIPVYSSVMRPVLFENENYQFFSTDKKYNSIFSLTSKIINVDDDTVVDMSKYKRFKNGKKKKERMDRLTALGVLQKKVNELWELVFSMINQKSGHIKDQVLGGRVNYSGRNVIIPDPRLRVNEVELGYMMFLELYKAEIIAHLTKINNGSPSSAYDEWYKAKINFSEKVYELMMYLVKKWKPVVLIDRNPTINYGSMLRMEIRSIKREFVDDYTMSLPIQILTVMGADFDGDILNVVALKTRRLAKAFGKSFNPRTNMYISRNDGLFNEEFDLQKDQKIGLREFLSI